MNSIADSLPPKLLINPWVVLIGGLDVQYGYVWQDWCHMYVWPACMATCDVLCLADVYSGFALCIVIRTMATGSQ